MGKDLLKHSPAAQARTRNNNDSSNTLWRLVFSTKTGLLYRIRCQITAYHIVCLYN